MRVPFIRLAAILTLISPRAESQVVAIRAGRLLDPATGRAMSGQVILVRDGRIEAVGGKVTIPADARVVDLSAQTVLPGLIDAHVHLAIGGPYRQNAKADLHAGFTTIADLGSRTNRMLRIRDSINAGQIEGPRVLASGMWIGTRNGVCEFGGLGIAGPDSAFVARARENLADGANLLKVCLSGWPAVTFANPDSVEMTRGALEGIVAEARRAGRRVIAHATSRASVQLAVDAGVDGLAHAAFLDSALVARLRQRDMFIISTLASLAPDSSPASLALRESLRMAHRAGVRIVAGTDGGVLPHGSNAQELQALAAIGLTPIQAIRAATVDAARALGIADSVGAIRSGMSADIIAVNGDPTTSLDVLLRPGFVMTRGRVVTH